MQNLESRSIVLNILRDFFLNDGFIELETPIILKTPCIEENIDAKIIITPDGPTGPEHKVKPGALILSQNSGKPIIPMIVDVKNSWKFKNWHTFYLSKPFSKMRVVYGEPLYFNKNESIETGTQKIEDALNKVDKVASSHE